MTERVRLRGAAPASGGEAEVPDAASVSSTEPVPERLRGDLEAAAGSSLAGVRLHRGPAANAVADSHDARAVTIGQDIHVADDELDPDSEEGEHLLAHEVAHTVQQRGGASAPAAKRFDEPSSSSAIEVEADRFADAFVAGAASAPLRQTSGVQAAAKGRDPDDDVGAGSEPAMLVVSTDRLDFSSTEVGGESPLQTVTLINAGTTPIDIEDVAELGHRGGHSPFTTYAGEISGPIEAGGSVAIQFAFRPSKVGPQSSAFQVITDGGAASAMISVEGEGVSGERSEVPVLKPDPKRLKLPKTTMGQYSEALSVSLHNAGHEPVAIESFDVEPSGSPAARASESEFHVIGQSEAAVEPGASTVVQVAFKPERPRFRSAKLLVKANQGATAAKVKMIGIGERVKDEAEITADRSDEIYDEALTDLPASVATETFSDMLAALMAVKRLTEQGDEQSYWRAYKLIEPVNDRMDALGPKAEKAVADYGSARLAGLMAFGHAHLAVYTWMHRLNENSSISAQSQFDTFQGAEEPIKLATGELEEAPGLRTLDRYGTYTAVAAGLMVGGAVLAPLAAELAPIVVAEGGLMLESASWIGSELAVWAMANPQAALALSEIVLGLGIQIGEGGWENFASQFESNEQIAFLVINILMDLMQAEGAMNDGGGAGRRRGGQVDDDSGGAPPRARDDADAPPAASRPTVAELPPQSARLRDRTLARVQQLIDAITEKVRGKPRAGGAGEADVEGGGSGAPRRSNHDGEEGEYVSTSPPLALGDGEHHVQVKKLDSGEYRVTLCSRCQRVADLARGAYAYLDELKKQPGREPHHQPTPKDVDKQMATLKKLADDAVGLEASAAKLKPEALDARTNELAERLKSFVEKNPELETVLGVGSRQVMPLDADVEATVRGSLDTGAMAPAVLATKWIDIARGGKVDNMASQLADEASSLATKDRGAAQLKALREQNEGLSAEEWGRVEREAKREIAEGYLDQLEEGVAAVAANRRDALEGKEAKSDPELAAAKRVADSIPAARANVRVALEEPWAYTNAGELEKKISKMDVDERSAFLKPVAGARAVSFGWQDAEGDIVRNNRDRTLFSDGDRIYSLDTQHGRFEVHRPNGYHLREINFDGAQTKPRDESGEHDLN